MTDFMTHDTEAKNFSIQTDDRADEASYDITVMSTLSIPTDWSMSSFTEVTSSISLQVIVQEECGETILDEFILNDMIIEDEGSEVIQNFIDV